MLYNVPGRTVTDIQPDTVVELARRFPGKIVALKDASGDLQRVVQHRMGAGPGFCQLSGDDPLVLAGYALGQVGCISVTANVAPKLCADFHAAAASGDFATARELNEKLYPLHKAMFADASPSACEICAEQAVRLVLARSAAADCRVFAMRRRRRSMRRWTLRAL